VTSTPKPSPRPQLAGRPPARGRERPRVDASFFDDLYEQAEDPWGFATSDYERQKYAHTISALAGRRFDRALEVGCAIGVFTAKLADVASSILAIDVSERALERARRRLNGHTGVRFARMSFPEECPQGRWDLIVCSEVLYYLDAPAFQRALTRLRESLEAGATVLAVHWRAPTRSYPLLGDEVHDQLLASLGRWHTLDDRRPRYRLDRFDGQGQPA
jgi:SAM-dependent methyltransferase